MGRRESISRMELWMVHRCPGRVGKWVEGKSFTIIKFLKFLKSELTHYTTIPGRAPASSPTLDSPASIKTRRKRRRKRRKATPELALNGTISLHHTGQATRTIMLARMGETTVQEGPAHRTTPHFQSPRSSTGSRRRLPQSVGRSLQ